MESLRATFGVDVSVDLTGRPARSGLEDELRDAVHQGRLGPGARLPSSRTLAAELGLARNTVADAYGQLVAEGWLVTRHGAGTWVADRPLEAPSPDADAIVPPETPPRFDLRPGVPDVGTFPRTAWLAAARRALAEAPDTALGYGDPRGLPVLRHALAGYLARARRVAASPERIVVCAGFAEGLDLICGVLRERGGKTVAIEALGHRLHREIVAASGLRPRPVPVDERGAGVERFGDAAAALLTPAHQFPLGVALDPDRRREAVEWAAANESLVIEDDYDGEFRYDRQAVGAVQSLAPTRVIYAGTASKSLAPGLRLAWLVLPAELVEEVVELKRSRGKFPGAVEQLTLAELIESGGFDRHVRRVRLAYRRRRERLLRVLGEAAPGARVSGMAAGLHALVDLEGRDEAKVVERATGHGLALQGLRLFAEPGHEREPALVIGYATPPEHAYGGALARLGAVLSA